MSKQAATKQAVPVMQTPEQYEGFEESVLAAAREQAEQIVSQAKNESEAAYRSALSRMKGDPIAARRTENKAALRRKMAAAQQENLRKLLVYRKQLVNGLFAEAEEALLDFTATPAYTKLLTDALTHCGANLSAPGCTVLLRPEDLTDANKQAVLAAVPGAVLQADPTIRLGGMKVIVGRVVYDETLEERVRAQRTSFLIYSGLHVAAPQQEEQA